MKKGKNITLLIGIACVFTVVLLQVIESIFDYIFSLNKENFQHIITWDISPFVLLCLLLIIPVVLLVRNLKNKTGKLLPIISILTNCTALLWVLFLLFTPTIPQYLIISKPGLMDTYFTVIVQFLKSGGLLFFVGYTLLIFGSFLSLSKNRKQD